MVIISESDLWIEICNFRFHGKLLYGHFKQMLGGDKSNWNTSFLYKMIN